MKKEQISRMLCLIGNTISKEYRTKTLLFLVILTCLMLLGINSLMDRLSGMAEEMLKTQVPPEMLKQLLAKKIVIFYGVISFWGTILAVLMGVQCVRSDFDHKVASQLLSLPIRRGEYLGCRILGTWVVVMAFYILCFAWSILFLGGATQGSLSFLALMGGLFLHGLSLLSTITISVLFSLFLPKILSFIGVFILSLMISSANNLMMAEGEWIKKLTAGIFEKIGLTLHYLLPRIGTLNAWAQDLFKEGQTTLTLNAPMELGHFGLSYALLMTLLIVIFNKKELSL